MSFMLTKTQVLARTKTVTRRAGSWEKLRPGDLLRAVEKTMGLRAGQRVVPLATIRVVDVRLETLQALTDDPAYGLAECRLEGFGDHPTLGQPEAFVEFYCSTHRGCLPSSVVRRIQFEYVD